jgi:hypothetical protein
MRGPVSKQERIMAEIIIATTGLAMLAVIICIHRRHRQHQVEYQQAIAIHFTISRLTRPRSGY